MHYLYVHKTGLAPGDYCYECWPVILQLILAESCCGFHVVQLNVFPGRCYTSSGDEGTCTLPG